MRGAQKIIYNNNNRDVNVRCKYNAVLFFYIQRIQVLF